MDLGYLVPSIAMTAVFALCIFVARPRNGVPTAIATGPLSSWFAVALVGFFVMGVSFIIAGVAPLAMSPV